MTIPVALLTVLCNPRSGSALASWEQRGDESIEPLQLRSRIGGNQNENKRSPVRGGRGGSDERHWVAGRCADHLESFDPGRAAHVAGAGRVVREGSRGENRRPDEDPDRLWRGQGGRRRRSP